MDVIRNSIRCRFRVDGKQTAYHLGLHDNDESRKKAKLIAKQVELELLADNFDQTFERYGVYPVYQEISNNRAVFQLFADFIAWKEEYVYKRTIETYKTLPRYLESIGIEYIATKRINT